MQLNRSAEAFVKFSMYEDLQIFKRWLYREQKIEKTVLEYFGEGLG